jgi:hypothetical protein
MLEDGHAWEPSLFARRLDNLAVFVFVSGDHGR